MKRAFAVLFLLVTLCGCTKTDHLIDRAMSLRETILESDTCTFDAVVTADYSDRLYTFGLQCQMDNDGNVSFSVTLPQTIEGLSGVITSNGGNITFDDQVLAFESLADGQITPVTAPWVVMNTLRSGYINTCSEEEGNLKIVIDDSYRENPLKVDVWLDRQDIPDYAEILWQGRRILSIEINNFACV